jgi:hypothetical protein
MSHASRHDHVQDLILDLQDLNLAQALTLQELAKNPEDGRACGLEQVRRMREQLRPDLYRQFEQSLRIVTGPESTRGGGPSPGRPPVGLLVSQVLASGRHLKPGRHTTKRSGGSSCSARRGEIH